MAIASLIVDYKGNLTRFAFYLLTENLLIFKDDRFRACHRSANRFLKFAYQFDIAFSLEVISRLDIRVLIAYLSINVIAWIYLHADDEFLVFAHSADSG